MACKDPNVLKYSTDIVLALCEAGGREVVGAPVVYPANAGEDARRHSDGWLPLHWMANNGYILQRTPLISPLADAFRLLLRLYPEAVSVKAGRSYYKKTPYHLAVDKGFSAYYLRLLLRAAPHLDPAELYRLNWEERRVAMFLAYAALSATPPLLARLRYENKDLVKLVVSFL
jgi:hypothetical protein